MRAMATLRRVIKGRVAVLARHDFSSGRGEWLFESPRNPVERQAYATQHSARNPWFISSIEYRPGRVMTGDELLHPDELLRTDFYRCHLQHLGLFHRLCGVLNRRGDVVWYVDLLRGPEQPPFDESDKSLFRSILRHVSLSLENHWTLLGAQELNQALRSVMDGLAPAVFVVDSRGRVLLRSARCVDFLQQCPGVTVREGSLSVVSRTEERALLEAISETVHQSSLSAQGGDRVVTVSSPGDPRPAVLLVRPAGKLAVDDSRRQEFAALVVAKSPYEPAHDMRQCAFSRIYELTPAQARLAGLILAGHRLAESAQVLSVSENTVRSHLKQIYQKTGTHGQLDLVRLHARLCTEFL
jgi:DNA-binding CsgD family transcriptional regulator